MFCFLYYIVLNWLTGEYDGNFVSLSMHICVYGNGCFETVGRLCCEKVYLSIAYFAYFRLAGSDQADVSFGSTQPSLSSSLSESSDSDSSMATRRASIEATSWKFVERSISFCSIFSTFRSLIPVARGEMMTYRE